MTITAPKLHITIDDLRWKTHRLGLDNLCARAIDSAWTTIQKKSSPPIFVSITFTNDKEIKKINAKTRGKNKPTNILSFQSYESVDDLPKLKSPIPVGDLILSYETILTEAHSEQKPLKNHLTHLLIHGFLHLFGYDHMTEKDAQIMEKLEIKLLKPLGIPNPYE